MYGKWFAATEDYSWGHIKGLYLAGNISRNQKKKAQMLGTAEQDAAKIGEKMGIKKSEWATFTLKERMCHKIVFLVVDTLPVAQVSPKYCSCFMAVITT